MTAHQHTANSAPRTALSASLAASTPLAGASRHPEALSGALRAAQRLAVAPEPAWTDSCAFDPEPDDGDDGPWCPTPNWRDQPDELQRLCRQGARQLHGEWGVARDTDAVTVSQEYL